MPIKKKARNRPSDGAHGQMWGGRFDSGPHPYFVEFNDSLPFDHLLLEFDIQGSIAYARALGRAGILSRQERDRIIRGLQAILRQHRRDPRGIVASGVEDVHTYVERSLERRVGKLAGKLHTGRSRNDQVATDLRLYLMDQGSEIETDLRRVLLRLHGLAAQHGSVILPGYTHLQRAQPVLFSHYLLAYGEMLLRDRARLREAMARTAISPLGSGALSGTPFDVDRTALARELGFVSITYNSMDAVSDRDFVLDFLYFSSVLCLHLSRLSEDLILFSSAEFGFVELDDAVTTGSSLMPQKKNPDALELVRAKTGRVLGHLVALLTVLKGLPMTYNKDLQEDKEGLFDAVTTVRSCLRMISLVLQHLQIQPARMQEATRGGFASATELADYLVAKEVPFRDAHSIVGRIVRHAVERGTTLDQLPIETYTRFSPHFREDLYRWLQPEAGIERRREAGGTSPVQARRALRAFRRRIDRRAD